VIARWVEEHPFAADTALAVLIVAFAVPNELGETSQRLAGVAFSLALAACVPFRRRAPVAVFVVVSVLCLVQFAVLERIAAGDVVALIAIYTLVAYSSLGAIGTVCGVIGALLAALRWQDSAPDLSLLQVAATTVISVLLAATLGAWRRSRRMELSALRERNRLLRDSVEDVSGHRTAHQRLPKNQMRMVLEIGELPRLERFDSNVTFLREVERLLFRGDFGIGFVAYWRDGAGLVDGAGVIDDRFAIGRKCLRIVPVRTPVFKCIGHEIELLGLPR